MKLPSFRQIFTQDYEEQYKKLIDTLSVSLNNGITVLYNALNNNITLNENMLVTVKTLQVQVDASGNPLSPIAFALNTYMKSTRVQGLSVINAINVNNSSSYPSSGVFTSFTQSGSNILVNNITGLLQGETYNITIVAWG